MTGSLFGSTLFLSPKTEQIPSSYRTGVTSNTTHTGPRVPNPGTPVPTWPRQVSPSAALGTSPLPRRPPCSSAWSSPPSTCPAVQVIVLSFFLGHLGKGRAGLRGRGGFLGPGWPCRVERGNRSFPGGLGREPRWESAGVSWVCLSHSIPLLGQQQAPGGPCHKEKKKCGFVSISLTMEPNW